MKNKALQGILVSRHRRQRGAVIILVAVLLVVFIGLGALAIDVSHLYVVRNELHNAADAGALAGARVLYNDTGTAINAGANQEAYDAATANKALTATGAIAVDVNWISGNTGDVQRGHWSFGLGDLPKGFYPNDSLAVVSLAGKTQEDLDEDENFINAVKVVTRREDTPAASFFARVFGYQDFALSSEAVAYIGFAGTLRPADVDQPIAICKQSIVELNAAGEEIYTCNTGRMINSSGGTSSNTAAWTNFSQPCATATPPTLSPLICGSGNPEIINLGSGIGTVNGAQTSNYDSMRDCWLAAAVAKDWRGYPKEAWTLNLPVIDCPSNAISPCSDVVGAVTVDVLWINQHNADPNWREIPMQMEGWECSIWVGLGRPTDLNSAMTETQRQQCWQEFASNFNLKTADETSVGSLSPDTLQKTMFFRPDCDPHELTGTTGGANFGGLSAIPVLVK